MHRYHFYDLKVHFWWPNKCLFSYNQRWNTLYNLRCRRISYWRSNNSWRRCLYNRWTGNDNFRAHFRNGRHHCCCHRRRRGRRRRRRNGLWRQRCWFTSCLISGFHQRLVSISVSFFLRFVTVCISHVHRQHWFCRETCKAVGAFKTFSTVFGCKIFVFFLLSFPQNKRKNTFAQLVLLSLYIFEGSALLFNFWMIKFTIMSKKTT